MGAVHGLLRRGDGLIHGLRLCDRSHRPAPAVRDQVLRSWPGGGAGTMGGNLLGEAGYLQRGTGQFACRLSEHLPRLVDGPLGSQLASSLAASAERGLSRHLSRQVHRLTGHRPLDARCDRLAGNATRDSVEAADDAGARASVGKRFRQVVLVAEKRLDGFGVTRVDAVILGKVCE